MGFEMMLGSELGLEIIIGLRLRMDQGWVWGWVGIENYVTVGFEAGVAVEVGVVVGSVSESR